MILRISLFTFYLLALFFTTENRSIAQQQHGFTFSRSQGFSTNSSASSVTLGTTRVLDPDCKSQIQKFYNQHDIINAQNQGCITQSENVISLPNQPGKLDQFEIIDKRRQFGVADRSVSSISEAETRQKTMSGFTGLGYSVFTLP